MPFIDNILEYSSLSIIGTEKNTGKTECLNYIISRLKNINKIVAITSIGIDGETVDLTTNTPKPEIELFNNMLFVTSEKHYKQRNLTSEIIDISQQFTSLGPLITARCIINGKIILSGPTNTKWLKQIINQLYVQKADLVIVDGALSRKSLASPSVTDSLILTTGAALSVNLNKVVEKTYFLYKLINIDKFETDLEEQLNDINKGIWAIDKDNNIHDLKIESTLLLEDHKNKLFEYGNKLFISGIITDRLLNFIRLQPEITTTTIIAKDFTKLFVSPEALTNYLQKGGKISVLTKTKLIAVCINPTSPSGYTLNSDLLIEKLQNKLNIPVYNIKNDKSENI